MVHRSTRIAPRRRSLLVVMAVVVAAPMIGAPPAFAFVVRGATRPPANTWAPTGAMAIARSDQTATLLRDGKVLVAGGATAKAELYDPKSRTFSPAGAMSVARRDATATLLPDGDVLVAGGCCRGGSAQLSSAELYDPATGTWSATGSMSVARSGQTATLLPDGDVLVAGGGCNGHAYGCDAGSSLTNLSSAELYDPATGLWSATGSMSKGRQFQTATLLGNGEVLVAGGFNNCDDDFCSDISGAELYDSNTGKWSPTGSMHLAREQHTATLLTDGDVLVAGGLNEGGFRGGGGRLSEAELYNPFTGAWTATASMAQPRAGHTATLLTNGWVLIAGGSTSSAQLYEPQRAIWVTPGSMSTPRTSFTATLLGTGDVLVTGGTGPDGQAQETAELYLAGNGPLVTLDPTTLAFGAAEVGTRGAAQTYTVTNNGSADLAVSGVTTSGAHPADFVAGTNCSRAPVPPGGSCTVSVAFAPTGTGLRTAAVAVVDNAPQSPQAVTASGYGAGPDAWAPTGSMATGRAGFTATLLPSGKVLVAGGDSGPETSIASAELYDPATHAFTPTGSLNQARADATAALLPDGDVLVVGGIGPGVSVLASAELYHPATGKWTLTTAMNDSGYFLSSVVLASGNVLVAGFVSGNAEVFDPAQHTWTDTGPVVAPGFFSTATLLPNGKVLAAGGNTTAAALYDPATNDWVATGSMKVAQGRPTATRMPDGDVLVAGGAAPGGGDPESTSELYDPGAGTWALTPGAMNVARVGQTATLLPNGFVLVAGGCSAACDTGHISASSELFNETDGFWFPVGTMTQAREGATATLLASGDVLVAGGSDYCCKPSYASAELFNTTLLSAHPTSGPVGQVVTLNGRGFFAHERVTVSWDSSPLGSARTTSQGTFAVEVTVPATNLGTHTISVRGQTSFAGAGVEFQVTAAPSRVTGS